MIRFLEQAKVTPGAPGQGASGSPWGCNEVQWIEQDICRLFTYDLNKYAAKMTDLKPLGCDTARLEQLLAILRQGESFCSG